MAPRKQRKVVVDKKTAEAMKNAKKDEVLDENAEAPIPDDGLDHMRWPAEARKLALLRCDPQYIGMTQEQLGEACGYSLRSVQRYFADDAFNKYCNEVAERVFTDDLYPIYVAGLRKGMIDGNAKFFEMYGKHRGYFKDVKQITGDVNVNNNTKNTNDALDDELERLEREIHGGQAVN